MGSCYSAAANWKKSAGSSKVEEEGEEGEVTTTWSTGVAGGCNCSLKKKKQQLQDEEKEKEKEKEKRRRKSKKKWDNEGWDGNNGAGKMWMNGVNKSETACLYTQQGNKGINQDSMLVWENFSSRSDTIFCGVFDGHGPFGHMVSKKVRDSLPLLFCAQWKSDSCDGKIHVHGDVSILGKMHAEETTSEGLDDEFQDSLEGQENDRLPEMYFSLKKAMLKAFKLMDKELKLHPTIDCFCSGTTAVTLIKQGQDLVIGNLGDSRAVLATRDKDNTLLAVQLTVDLKPDLPREAARIQQCKGRVFALQDEPEVARVWLPNSDSPGLAMARAFGDFCLKDFGLISVPEIYYYPLTSRDEFVILATDGVWDVLSNKEAVSIVAAAPGRATAARALVECAIRAWKLKYPTSKNDDCAVVCLFLKHSCASNGCVDNNHVPNIPQVAEEDTRTKTCASEPVMHDNSNAILPEHSNSWRSSDEIVPVSMFTRERSSVKSNAQSKKTLAECISTTDDEEWSALEGIVRVNSLLSLPRFLPRDKR